MIALLLASPRAFCGNLDEQMRSHGLTDMAEVAPEIRVDLMYARDDNFTGVCLYDSLTRAYLHPLAANSLAKAQQLLNELYPGYTLLVKDAARPLSVQKRMYDTVKGTPKANYVANPARGAGLHNYGLAVDVTIADPQGRALPMGTPVDHLGPEANIDREVQLVKRGVISETERQNRLLLRRVMREAGFSTIRTEWWHFNRLSRQKARSLSIRLLDF